MTLRLGIGILIFSMFLGCASSYDRAKPYVNTATEHYNAQQWEQCIEACNQALAIYPDFTNALSMRGFAKHKAGFPAAEALADLDSALAQYHGRNGKMYLQRAYVRYDTGMYQGAEKDCFEAIRYFEARGFNPDLIGAQRRSGKAVEINLGDDVDGYWGQLKKEAVELLGLVQKAMEE